MKAILTTFFFLCSVILLGQSKDSIALFDSLLEQSKDFHYNGQLDSARYYAEKLQKFPLNTIPEELRLKHITNFAKLQGDITKAISILTKEEQYQKSKKNYRNLGHIFYAKGANYFDASYDRDALINYIKADSILAEFNTESWLVVMSKVGIVNVLMKSDYTTDPGKFDQAAVYIDEGIALSDSIGFIVGSSILLEKKAHYLQLKDQLKESMIAYKKALEVSLSINYTLRESSIYDGMAKVYVKQRKPDSAATYFEKHLALIKETSYALDIAEAHYNIGEFYNQTSNFPAAKSHLEEAWALIQELPEVRKEYPYNIQSELAKSYSGLNDHQKALKSLNSAMDLLEEVHGIKNSENIRELETRYRTDKKEQEIALLRSKNELAEQQKKSQRNILLGGIGLTSLAGIFLFVLFKNRQRTNKKLREIDALKTNLFTNISHEFRTPLTLISTPIQESLQESNLPDEKRKHFEIAQKNTKRLSSLVDQLLELSKIDSGSRSLVLENNTPTQFISAWSESFSYLSKQKNIKFKTEIESKEIRGWFDREALENIVVNLLGNAIKYTPDRGQIILHAGIKNDILNFSVSNTGEGLTNSQLKTIFNRFYQTNGFNEGAGIGLSLVKELVELHGGTITADSAPNEWTSFNVSLGLDKNKLKNAVLREEMEIQSSSFSSNSENKRPAEEDFTEDSDHPLLLIVEDHPELRVLLKDTFKKDFSVIEAENGEEGIRMALEQIPDIIISDLMMPVKDGMELTKTLKTDERSSHIPVLLLTAKAGDENKLLGLDAGADDYITKPFNQKILKSKVANLMALRKKLQARYSQEVILKPKDIAITSLDEQFLEKVQDVLDKNLVESGFSTEAFSKAVHMSRMQLHRKLKALTGLSASEFIRSQRLKLATQLLLKTDQNVSDIGYKVGFNDPAYFAKCFRKAYQCTPSEYAKKITKLQA